MKKLIVIVLVGMFGFSSVANAEAKWLYIHDMDFMNDYALVQRTDGLYNGDLYLIETSFCMAFPYYTTDQWALWTGSNMFLDGIGDKIVNVNKAYGSTECRIWDAFPIEDWEDGLSSYEYAEFWQAVNNY